MEGNPVPATPIRYTFFAYGAGCVLGFLCSLFPMALWVLPTREERWILFFFCDLKFMGCFISRMPIVGKIFSCNDLLSIGRTHLDLVTSGLDRVLHRPGGIRICLHL